MSPIEVKLDPNWKWRLGCLAMVLMPVGGSLFIAGLRSFSAGESGRGQVMFLLGLAALGSFLYFPLFARRWARRLDDKGITLRNGRFFPWDSLKSLTRVKRQQALVRYELKFKEGNAYVLPLMVLNGAEVSAAIEEIGSKRAAVR